MPPSDETRRGHPRPEHPPHHIEHVDAHVAHNAVAIFHERAPAARVHQAVVRAHGRGARPHFVIEIGRRIRVGRIAGRAHVIVAADLDQGDGAELAFVDEPVACLDDVRRAAPLRADLHHALVAAGGGQHSLAFANIHADGLLHIDVCPRLDGGNHSERVPVVGRGHQHDVQILLLEHLAIVAVRARPFAGCLAGGREIGRVREHLFIHIA